MSNTPHSSPEEGIAQMVSGSLKAASMEHGLQYNAIYWETGHRTYLPFWASLNQKFSWKIMDDQVQNFLGMVQPTTRQPFVFYGDSAYFRKYYGDPDLNIILPLKKKSNFSFAATGVDNILDTTRSATQMNRSEVFNAILHSAFEIDYKNKLYNA